MSCMEQYCSRWGRFGGVDRAAERESARVGGKELCAGAYPFCFRLVTVILVYRTDQTGQAGASRGVLWREFERREAKP